MAQKITRLFCLLVGCAAAWAVYTSLTDLLTGWIPIAVAAAVALVVYSALYFPLARHIADMVSDRMSVMMHRGRHIRTGSGIDEVPDVHLSPTCSMCGGPEGPICKACNEKMLRSSRTSVPGQ
jgi:hypothetical protein